MQKQIQTKWDSKYEFQNKIYSLNITNFLQDKIKEIELKKYFFLKGRYHLTVY